MSTPSLLMTSTAPGGAAGGLFGLLPFVLVFIIFYFLMIRPQQRRVKEQQATIAAVKKGDEVVTAGGIKGRVTRVTDDEAEIEIAPNTRVRVVKATLSQVLTKSAKPAND